MFQIEIKRGTVCRYHEPHTSLMVVAVTGAACTDISDKDSSTEVATCSSTVRRHPGQLRRVGFLEALPIGHGAMFRIHRKHCHHFHARHLAEQQYPGPTRAPNNTCTLPICTVLLHGYSILHGATNPDASTISTSRRTSPVRGSKRYTPSSPS